MTVAAEMSASHSGPSHCAETAARPWQCYRVAVVVTLLGWLANAWPWLTQQVTIPWDAKAHFQAQFSFLAQSLARGESPFWAPYVFSGHPQIADPQALIFSPPALLAAWLFPDPGLGVIDALAYLHLLVAALAVLAIGRDRDWHPAAAVVAALAIAFGGSAAWRNQHIGQIFSLAHLPVVLFLLDRAFDDRRRAMRLGCGAAAGVVTALMLANRDQVAFLGALLLTIYTLVRIVDGAWVRARFLRAAGPLALGALAGLVVLAVPIAFVIAFADLSNRPAIGQADAEMGSLHPTALLTLVFANLFGTNGPATEFWGAPSMHWPYIVPLALARNMSALYLGLLPFVGILYALASGVAFKRGARAVTLCFVIALLYALGRYSPLFGLFHQAVPGVDLFRRPADATFLVGGFGALLAGIGLSQFLNVDGRQDRAARVATLSVLAMFFALAIFVAHHVGRLYMIAQPMTTAALTILASLAALLAIRAWPGVSGLAPLVVLGGAVTLDLAWNNRPSESTGLPPETYAAMAPDMPNETVATLKRLVVGDRQRRDRVEIAGMGFHWPNIGLVHQLESTLGYNPLRLGIYSRATGAIDHVSGPDQRRLSKLFPSYRAPLANLLGLRFIATGVPIEQIDPTLAAHPLPLVAQTADGYIYENRDAAPRVGIAERALPADQDGILASGEFPSADPMRVAAIEPGAPLVVAAPGSMASILRYTNTVIDIAVVAPGGGTLLLNDIYHPWWRATIDDVPAPVYRANAIFRAVVLPPGARRVRFIFGPFSGLAHDMARRIAAAIGGHGAVETAKAR